MPNNKLKDNEITKALECCIGDTEGKNCFDCPLYEIDDCQAHMYLDALDLINRLQADNKDLFYKLAGVMHSVDKWLDCDELKQDEVNRAATMREKTLQIVEDLQAENERLRQKLNIELEKFTTEYDDKIKAEAYTEFAERLKENSFQSFGNYGITRDVVEVCDIDNLVKELEGEDK